MSETADYDKSATPAAHKTSHQDAGTDEISVEALAGVLTSEQKSAWSLISGKPSVFPPDTHTHTSFETLDVTNFTCLIPPITISASGTLTAAQCKGQVALVTAAATPKLPPVAAGSSLLVYSTGANIISVDPDDADRIRLDGAALTDGHKITSPGAAGDFVMLYADGTDGWTVIGRSGTWTDGG